MGVLNCQRWGRHRHHRKAADAVTNRNALKRALAAALVNCKLLLSRLTNPFRIAATEACYEVACYREACAHYHDTPSKFGESHRAAGTFFKALYQQGKDRLHVFSDHDLTECTSCGFSRRAHANKDVEFDINYSPCAEFREPVKPSN